MATTTTNFGWDIPQSTDLVKDGATAIAALGQDIDTAFVDFKGGTTGQVLKKTSGTDLDVEWGTASSGLTLINTTSFSAVASQSFNNVFTTSYNNYRIVANDLVSSSGGFITMRLRASAADNTTSNYRFRSYRGSVGGPGGDDNSQYSSSTTSFQTIYTLTGSDTAGFSCDVFAPQLAKQTQIALLGFDAPSNGYTVISGGRFADTTQFDGFSLILTNITGTVSIYGYAK
jgi:hypothetical protein